LLFALCGPVEGQTQPKIPKIGVLEPGLSPAKSATAVCRDWFRQGLRELGYLEGRNIGIEYRFADGDSETLPKLAAELVRLKPDLIWTHSIIAARTAKQATTTIPVVVGVAVDFVEHSLAGSLARPGGNVTGLEHRDSDLMGKRLELLKQAVPTASRVAVLIDPANPAHDRVPGNIETEARALRVQLQRVEANGPDGFNKAFTAMTQGRADALMIPEGAMLSRNRHRIFELATSKRLPTISGGQHFAEAGSLLSYGANVGDICRRSAVFVDKILKGSKPADLPVERATKFEFVVNLKTAKAIGIKIPADVLARADRVIK
ncbi:MAG: ABC transporter substrate-binding protein, partial [Deltaproteobacteria bacterium]|nr:ABC transporter substrate-binding protein [Deltaproteobacteria bacterium]